MKAKGVKRKRAPRGAWNTPRVVIEHADGTGEVCAFVPKGEGDALSFVFPGFAVYLDHEGCALLLTSGHREAIKNLTPGQDRILTNKNLKGPGPLGDALFDRVLARTLAKWPKDRVP